MIAPVDEVPDHDELVVWEVAALVEEVLDVEELAMHIAGDVDWGINADYVGLLGEDSLDHVAEGADCGLSDGLAVEGRLIPRFNAHLICNIVIPPVLPIFK